MGSLYWQINDCWPVASWSGIDYYGNWKALHYFVKEAYKNTVVFMDINPESRNIEFRIVSDLPENHDGILKIKLMDFNGNNLGEKEVNVEIPANNSKMGFEIPARDLLKRADKKGLVLVATLESDNKQIDRALYYFAKPKDLKLPEVILKTYVDKTDGYTTLTLESDKLVKNVFLFCDDCRFSDNYFDVLPNEEVAVLVESTLGVEELQKQIKVLHLEETMR
jgi:beta-mannosidase